MISSPPPTQQPLRPGTEKAVRSTPSRRRAGQTPAALFVKAIFRPIFKGIYYLLQAIRHHKLVTLLIIILLAGSITATSYLTTGEFPFGIGNDPFNFHVHGANGGGDMVQNWLYALRDGNASQLQLLDKDMSSPPNPTQLISQYSQSQAHLSWKAINVVGIYSESDTTVDSIVEVDVSANGPGGNTTGIMIWHFVTITTQGEHLLSASLVDFRAPLQ